MKILQYKDGRALLISLNESGVAVTRERRSGQVKIIRYNRNSDVTNRESVVNMGSERDIHKTVREHLIHVDIRSRTSIYEIDKCSDIALCSVFRDVEERINLENDT